MGFGWPRNGSSRRTDCQAIKEQRKGAAWNMRCGIAAFFTKIRASFLFFPQRKIRSFAIGKKSFVAFSYSRKAGA